MSRTIMLIPISSNVGLTSVTLGVMRAMEHQGVSLGVFKPIAQSDKTDPTTTIIQENSHTPILAPLSSSYVEGLLGSDQQDVLLEEIIARYHAHCLQAEVVLVEGLIPNDQSPFADNINYALATALNAEIVLVMVPVAGQTAQQFNETLALACQRFGGEKNISGVILNKINAPVDQSGRTRPDLLEVFTNKSLVTPNQAIDNMIANSPLPILGSIPWHADLIATRAIDIANHLNASIINQGDIQHRRVTSITFCARSLANMLEYFRPGALLVTSADRPDVLSTICLAAMNGVEIGAVLLTGGYQIEPQLAQFYQRALQTGLPVMLIEHNTWQTALELQNFTLEIPADDHQRVEKVQEYIAQHIDKSWIDSLTAASSRPHLLSPPAFRYQLTELARKANKSIVLPEGEEPRTIKAAALCAERGIARCLLLGNPATINQVASAQGIKLPANVIIIDPATIREKYVARIVELRKNKGMTEVVAREQLQDNVVLGTMMLEADEVDGLVSGAVHTTANTIRPPLQFIKTAPGSSLVSSVFFMLLPDQVLVYGDCAINPDPSAEQLAEIAIQSAASAQAFGIEPRVAMISYSTGTSGSGSDVDKVREATEIAKQKAPHLIIDGPLQYDAAIMADVAQSKAPNSPVAGKATVFIFPDLNTGNTTYKAVQRSANLLSIGPMLQGMRKPVNDLSRGALVDDIVYTIALTAIQATQQPS